MKLSDLRPEHSDIVEQFIQQHKSENYSFMLTVARDGEEPARSIYNFSDAVTAAEAFSRYEDWGFAKQYLTVRLYEPNGNIQEKILQRPPAGECSFIRQNYIDAANLLLDVKKDISQPTYEKIVGGMALIFFYDIPRFDEKRFFNQTKVNQVKD